MYILFLKYYINTKKILKIFLKLKFKKKSLSLEEKLFYFILNINKQIQYYNYILKISNFLNFY
jgi:hypothetical protein